MDLLKDELGGPRPTLHQTLEVGPFAGELVRIAVEAAKRVNGRARLALSGGSSPGPVLDWLAEHLEVERLLVTWTDERHVDWDPRLPWTAWPDALNLRQAWARWFALLPAPPEHLPLDQPGPLEAVRAERSAAFSQRLGGLDVVLLGAGPDGHVASLFPGHPALEEVGPVVAVTGSPKAPPERLSLSLPVLCAAHTVILVATGAAKASMLARAWAGDPTLPLSHVRPRGALHWVLDPDAASLLPEIQ